jgi:glutaredoxin
VDLEYELFTYPNCPRCETLKAALAENGLEGRTFDLSRREGKLRIREYLKVLKRDDQGAIIIPTLILTRNGESAGVVNTREELRDWLLSKG